MTMVQALASLASAPCSSAPYNSSFSRAPDAQLPGQLRNHQTSLLALQLLGLEDVPKDVIADV